MKTAQKIMAIGLLISAAMPANAAGNLFTPPAGCEAYLTVQSRGCRVSNHYICSADNPGDKWRADFDQEGIFFLSKVDNEAQWIESIDQFPTVIQKLDPNPKDPASFSNLLTGEDTFDFTISRDDGTASHVTGFDRLTGKSFVIDGVNLQQTQFEFTETDLDGNVLAKSRGNEFISPDWRMFFSGPSEWDAGDGYLPMDGSPVQFINPGEPGFLATEPLFECDAIMSSFPMQSKPAEALRHDDL